MVTASRAWLALALSLGACGNKPDGGAPAGSASAQVAPKADGLVEVELAPLGLTIRVPPGGLGALDMTLDDMSGKTALVDIGGDQSLKIAEEKASFDALKKQAQTDTVIFPFKRFVKETPSSAIVEFANEGKTGYFGFALVTVGGKQVVCKTTGLAGMASTEAVEKALALCGTLAPRKT